MIETDESWKQKRTCSFDPYKADIWALGVCVYMFLTYHYPFKGKNAVEYGMNVVNREANF